MIEIAGLWLLRPYWLLAVPLVALLAWHAHRRRGALASWGRILDPKLVPALEALGHVTSTRRGLRVLLLAATAALAVLALTGPATRKDQAPAFRNLDTVFLVVDLSDSMTRGGALDDLQAAAAHVLSDSSGRPVALLVFAADAYLASAPTEDPATLETIVSVLDAETMPDAGSRPDRALRLVREMLARAEKRRTDVLLISDGGGVNAETLHEAELLHGLGARVSAIYVAPTARTYGMPAPRRDALDDLARRGGGLLADAGESGRVVALLRESSSAAISADMAALTFEDHGRLVLLLALVPALLLFRRRR